VTYRLRTSEEADGDIDQVFWRIAELERDPLGALRWLDGLQDAIASLRHLALRCPLAPETAFYARDTRQLFYHHHRIVFAVDDDTVNVLHVRHMSRLPQGVHPDDSH
jgi:plasmid stabilization system protein ParE